MRTIKENIKNGFRSIRKDDERGDIAQTVIIIGLLVAAAVFAIKKLTDGISSQATKTGNVIKNAG